MIEEYKIDNSLVDELIKSLDLFKSINFCASDTCTVNGFQTENILKFDSARALINEILKDVIKDKKVECFHVHLIEYFKGGYQNAHNHARTEDYSFILYLNDSDGNTVFKDELSIKPEKGKLVYFKSDLIHWGEESNLNKKIAVGALKEFF